MTHVPIVRFAPSSIISPEGTPLPTLPRKGGGSLTRVLT